MKIAAIETIRIAEFPNIFFIEVETDTGLRGLGESFFGPQAIEAYVHETAWPILAGRDPLELDRIGKALQGYVGYRSAGAEMRGNSAIDIALWDIFGKSTGLPIYQLLGGKAREDIHIYNTCAGYKYIRSSQGQASDNWGIGATSGPYEDLEGFLHRADDLAESLLSENITGMKIWPFDEYAERSNGTYISGPDLATAIEPFRKIRERVGNRIDIMVELHGLWNVPTAKRIFEALEPYNPYWFEDPIRPDNIEGLAELARSTRVPIAVSETLSTRNSFRELLVNEAAGIAMVDVSWCGGISEARKIANLAEAFSRPVMFHDCTGPVVYAASTHLSMNATNALVQESVRAFYSGWYTELVTNLPPIVAGRITPPAGPGIGTELLPGFKRRSDVFTRRSAL